jgi:hypothetical protein
LIDRCQQRVGHLRLAVATDALVAVDGRRVEQLGEALDVLPGIHTVVVNAQGESEARSVDVSATQTVDISFKGPSEALAPPRTAAGMPLAPTERRPNPIEEARPPAGAFWTARNEWALGLGAAAVVFAGVGVGFGVAANGNGSAIDSMRAGKDSSFCTSSVNAAYCADLRSTVAAQRSDASASNVAFGFAGALAAGAVVLWVVWPKLERGHSGQWGIAPSLGTGSAGLVARGHF